MRSQDEPGIVPSAEGGDAACWLANVCDRCGAFNEVPGLPCWRCGGDTRPAAAAEASPAPAVD